MGLGSGAEFKAQGLELAWEGCPSTWPKRIAILTDNSCNTDTSSKSIVFLIVLVTAIVGPDGLARAFTGVCTYGFGIWGEGEIGSAKESTKREEANHQHDAGNMIVMSGMLSNLPLPRGGLRRGFRV